MANLGVTIAACPVESTTIDGKPARAFYKTDLPDGRPFNEVRNGNRSWLFHHMTNTLYFYTEIVMSQNQTPPAPPVQPAQPAPAPDKITAAELRTTLREIHRDIETILTRLAEMREAITAPAAIQPTPQPAPAPAAPQPAPEGTISFLAESVSLDVVEGKSTYKMRGGEYTKFGVRIWPEVLTSFVDPATLQPGVNPLHPPVMVIAVISDDGKPRKVIGRA